VNYGKHNSIFTLLQEDNKNVLKQTAQVIYFIMTKTNSIDRLNVYIEMIILKIYEHFSMSVKGREELVIL
jgi:hypothetical protein